MKSISFDIWQHNNLLAFKPCENCYSLHDNMANTNSIVVAAIDSEYFAIIFAKRDRFCVFFFVVLCFLFYQNFQIRTPWCNAHI